MDIDSCHSVAHLLEGDFVETGIDVARCAYLSFAVWYDEPHFCDTFFLAFLATDADIGEWNEPAAWNAGAAVGIIHGTAAVDFRVEFCIKATIVVGNLHNVGAWMPIVDIVSKLYAVAQDVELYEAADDACGLAFLELLACTFTHDLHVYARVDEKDVLVLGQIGSEALIDKLFFVDNRYLTDFTDDVAVCVAHRDVAFHE